MGWEDPLEEEMATHSNILAWKIPWTVEPGGLQSISCKGSDTIERLTHVNPMIGAEGIWHRHAYRRMPPEAEGRNGDQGDASIHQGMPKTVSKTPEARGEAVTDSFSQPPEGANPVNTSDMQPPEL